MQKEKNYKPSQIFLTAFFELKKTIDWDARLVSKSRHLSV